MDDNGSATGEVGDAPPVSARVRNPFLKDKDPDEELGEEEKEKKSLA